MQTIALLDFPEGTLLVRDESEPELYAVWLDGDVLGVGEDSEAAVQEARETLAGWAARRAAALRDLDFRKESNIWFKFYRARELGITLAKAY